MDPQEQLAKSEVQLAHRTHDPLHNEKRTDPFHFGSRFLEADDNVFEFNAWDHVEPEASFYQYAEEQYALQRANPVPQADHQRFNDLSANRWWNNFYRNNNSNFFKDRRWLFQEFSILTTLTAEKYGQAKIVELGAGAGNTVFPIMARNRNLFLTVHALDFSKTAIDLIRQNPDYDGLKIRADVWDLASESPPEGCEAGTVDVVLMIFVFSALSPDQWSAAVKNVFRMLKPGGTVLYRDYGRGDLTQVRLKKGRYLMENFYIRGDGTRVYYFEKDELIKIWSQPAHALEIQDIGVDRRMLVNRKKELKMYRAWIQGVFRKPDILRCAAPPACEVENA